MAERKPYLLSFRPKGEILNVNINSTIRFLATLEMTILLSFRSDTIYETFAKRLSCHCEQSEAISQHIDNPQDCHVASLLAMTKTAVIQRSLYTTEISFEPLYFIERNG